MKKIGILSYNIHVTYTNYGSALQSYALSKKIDELGFETYLVDYVPKRFEGIHTLDPIVRKDFNADEETKRMCKLTEKAFLENYIKYEDFFTNNFRRTKVYDRFNFNELKNTLDAFVCGSDTVFCIDEFGFDEGYFADFEIMRKKSVAFSASFGDSVFDEKTLPVLREKLQNFCAISIREKGYLDTVKDCVSVRVEQTIDPTLLLKKEDYRQIVAPKAPVQEERYILYYSRRYDKAMDDFVRKTAAEKNLKVIEISLRATNVEKGSIMRYDAGVEEFLSLIEHAEEVVTNSFHGMLLSIVFGKQFFCFTRPQNCVKMVEITSLLGVRDRLTTDGSFNKDLSPIDYNKVYEVLDKEREKSLKFLEYELKNCL